MRAFKERTGGDQKPAVFDRYRTRSARSVPRGNGTGAPRHAFSGGTAGTCTVAVMTTDLRGPRPPPGSRETGAERPGLLAAEQEDSRPGSSILQQPGGGRGSASRRRAELRRSARGSSAGLPAATRLPRLIVSAGEDVVSPRSPNIGARYSGVGGSAPGRGPAPGAEASPGAAGAGGPGLPPSSGPGPDHVSALSHPAAGSRTTATQVGMEPPAVAPSWPAPGRAAWPPGATGA